MSAALRCFGVEPILFLIEVQRVHLRPFCFSLRFSNEVEINKVCSRRFVSLIRRVVLNVRSTKIIPNKSPA